MQTNSNNNVEENMDVPVVIKNHGVQSWRSRNGLKISKPEQLDSTKNQNISPEVQSIVSCLSKHMDHRAVDADAQEADAIMCVSGNQVIRNHNQNCRDSGGSKNARQQTQMTVNEKNKITPLTHLLLYSEDMRISKILRRLLCEKSSSAAIDLCKKLELAVGTSSNAAYICRSFDILLENMITFLRQGPVECLEMASSILGLIGYINRTNFPIYRNCLTQAYQSGHGIEKYIMLALKTTIRYDAVNLSLRVHSESMLGVLKDYLENAVVAENFIAVSETIAEFSKNYKHEFEQHFTDIVDIVVGWHLEVEQPHTLKLHCSQMLQQFSVYFIQKLDFTCGLLGQFLEDILAFGEDITTEVKSLKSKQKAEIRFGGFVGAFTTILKSLSTPKEIVAFNTAETIIGEAIVIIIKTTKKMLSIFGFAKEETILNVNDFLCLMFNNYFHIVNMLDIEELYHLQAQQLEYYTEQQKISLLYLMLCIVRQLRTQLPVSLITKMFSVNPPNPLAAIKMTNSTQLYKLFLRIYREVLVIKNVPLLQEAYKHITQNMNTAISVLSVSETTSSTHERAIATSTLNFYLVALTALATQGSSIIGMYALKPSILELLISSCQAANMSFWSQHSTLHSALLQLIVVHSQKNHNFMPTSRLLLDHYEKNSLTSENFGHILKFLSEILNQLNVLCVHNLDILLKWLQQLLEACRERAFLLTRHEHFVDLCKSIAQAAVRSPLMGAACIEALLLYDVLPEGVLLCFRDTSMLLLDSFNPKVKDMYTVIYAKLPLRVTLDESKENMNALCERQLKMRELQQWYKATPHSSPFCNKYFKPFLESMELSTNGDPTVEQVYLDMYAHCWALQVCSDALRYQKMSRKSAQMLSFWLRFEVARYCVRNKLRTAVGKPQDTFLAIEALVMKYARDLTAPEQNRKLELKACTLTNLLRTQRNTRTLLNFIEELEKVIYNAAEGTAFVMLPPEKQARTFFRINSHTCQEWFKRISTGVSLIALHSMEWDMVIRFSESILKTIKFNDARIEHTITSLVWALLACEEVNTLRGLHVWLKPKTGKRYAWIQYVAEHAAGRREYAAEGYSAVINESNDGNMDSYTRDFLTDQLLDCLYNSGQWAKLRKVCSTLKNLPEPPKLCNEFSDAHLKMLETLCSGRTDHESAGKINKVLLELTDWNINDNNLQTDTPEQTMPTNFSYYYIQRKLENACIACSLKSDCSSPSEDVQSAIRLGLQESWRHGRILKRTSQQIDFVILNHVAQKLQINEANSSTASLDCNDSVEKSNVLLKCLLWTLLLEQRPNIGNSTRDSHNKLYLDVAASARREGNSNLSCSMLQQFFVLKGLAEPLAKVSERVRNNDYIIDINDADMLRGFSEMVRCMYVSPNNRQLEAISLGIAYCDQIIQQVPQNANEPLQYPENSANMLLTLADWLSPKGGGATLAGITAGSGGISSTNINTITSGPQLQHLLRNLPDLSVHVTDDVSSIIPNAEWAVGKLLNGSVCQNSGSGEAWCAYGNWCYRWGKKVMEARNTDPPSSRNSMSLRDLSAFKDILGSDTSEESIKQLVNVLNSHPLNVCDGIEDIEAHELKSSATEILETELGKLDIFANKPKSCITDIINIWRQTDKNVYAFYELATKAYFKYLAIEAAQTAPKHSGLVASAYVNTTLRILRLIVKHTIGLQDVLEEGLRNTPLRPWKTIIPQLFSRLNHHEPYVRKSVSDLLCRLAQKKPHLIIFPAVVGAQQELKLCPNNQLQKSTETHSNAASTMSASSTPPIALANSFSCLLQTLSKQSPEKVLHVQLLVKELKRITLLWEEYWVHSLAQVYSDYSPLFNGLEQEAKKAGDTANLKLQYNIFMQHLITDLRTIASVSQKSAETNYEHNFQERHNSFINHTISELEKCSVDRSKLSEGWQHIKKLYSVFQQRALKNTTSTMRISDLSPALANMRDTVISMPGVDSNNVHSVCIRAVESTVYVLPTKTKPKKLAFIGSDGRKYTYLFKGLEDLHLDERIMQFLSISNSMMARTDELQCTTNCYKAHYYSVIPLGPQSGLISWVDGVTPLFAIYKKWQQRDAALKQQQKQRSTTTSANRNEEQIPVATATRPSELFYSKLTPLLAEQNIKVTDPRKQWPLPTLRRVLKELCNETPRDLLAKELWCNAISATQWRQSVRSYAISVAVMSVIGYVIGLGDRHLDNVLIKLSTGEILHIDYNVCFEKGKTLRVPEKVPFRMTPNLEEALGIIGIEGTFRLGCEHVLKTLRKERETLLTLLEAFVYDPLVDWTVSDESSASAGSCRATSAHLAAQSINALMSGSATVAETTRTAKPCELTPKKHDWETKRQNVTARFNELKPYWTKYKDDIHTTLLKIKVGVDNLSITKFAIDKTELERDNLMKQHAMIHELEALGTARDSHALNTISQRYATYKTAAAAFNDIKRRVQKYHNEIKTILTTYFEQLLVSPSAASELMQMKQELYDQKQIAYANEYDAVRGFLAQGDQEQLHRVCDFVRKEMDNTIYQETRSATECLELLLQYASVMQFYHRTSLQQNHLIKYERWYWQLLDEQRDAACLKHEVEQWLQALLLEDSSPLHSSTPAQEYVCAMEKVWVDLNFGLHKAMNTLNEQKLQELPSPELAANALQSFELINPELNSNALHFSLLQTLTQANESFRLFEDAALGSGDQYLLDHQIDYIEVVQGMCHTVCPTLVAEQNSLLAFNMLGSTLTCLRKLKSSFELPFLERIVHLYMLDDNIELQEVLDMLCSPISITSLPALLQASMVNAELHILLTEMLTLFELFEYELQKLQDTVRDIDNLNADSSFKHFADLKIYNCNLNIFMGAIKVDTIMQVFGLARDQVNTLKDSTMTHVYDVRLLAMPIAEYVQYMQKFLLGGLVPLFVSALHDRLMALARYDAAGIDEITLSTAGMHTKNLFAALQHSVNIRNCQLHVLLYTNWVEHYTLVASAHFWANEMHLLRDSSQLIYKHIIYKGKLLNALQMATQSLGVWKYTLSKIQTELEEHTANILQKFCCAMDNSQQNWQTLHTGFVEDVSAQQMRYRFHIQLITKLTDIASVLHQVEILANGKRNSTFETDQTFLAIVAQWQTTFDCWRLSGMTITPVEQNIVQLLDPEGKVDQCWIDNISGVLDDMTFSVQRKLATLEKEEKTQRELLAVDAQQLQALIDAQLRIDMRLLLKAIIKGERNRTSGSVDSTRQRELQHRIKVFYANLAELQMQLTARNLNEPQLSQIKQNITESLDANVSNYGELLRIMQNVVWEEKAGLSGGPSGASSCENKSNNLMSSDTSLATDKKVITNQSEQKRNAYAVSVWKRIRMKLEGRDPDTNSRSTVAEQVDFIIREATNPDNLAVLYEGWTPWV